MKKHHLLIAVSCLMMLSACSSDAPSVITPDQGGMEPFLPEINQIKLQAHPRLLFTAAEEKELLQLLDTDPLAQKLQQQILQDAKRLLTWSLPSYKPDGRGTILNISREYLRRFLTLSMAYRFTHSDRYMSKVDQMLVNVCKFPDWHKAHFLDTAEMTAGVAVAYDWLYEALPEETKRLVRNTLKSRAIDLVLAEYEKGGPSSWAKRETNWNVVCNAGMVLGAMAVAEHWPEEAETIINNAVKYVPNCLQHFAPDGVCYEGPGYWEYTHDYLALLLDVLHDNFQTDYDLSKLPGISRTSDYYVQTLSPTGKVYNFADAASIVPTISPAILYYSQLYHQSEITGWYRRLLTERLSQNKSSNRFLALALPWLIGTSDSAEKTEKPRLRTFHGINDLIVFNASPDVPSSIYLIAKGGDPDRAHQQMDGGSFVLETDGIRWADELGSENYNLPGFWDVNKQRWNYFRNTNFSHSTLHIDDKLQNPKGEAHLVEEHPEASQPYAVLDMTSLYQDQATHLTRKFQLMDDRTVELTDEFQLADASSSVNWTLVTRTHVTIDQNRVLLQQDGKQLSLEILTPPEATFSERPAYHTHSDEKPLDGVRLVTCTYKPQTTAPRKLHLRLRSLVP